MPASLATLPFDLMHDISSYFDIHDYEHLSRVSTQCRGILHDETISRKTVQKWIPYTREARKLKHVADENLSNGKVIKCVHGIRESVASAKPYSVKHGAGGNLSNRKVIECVHSIRESVASAKPYSVSLVAYGDLFVYSEGILCYAEGPHVRILDIHCSSETEEVIDVRGIDQKLASKSGLNFSTLGSSVRITSLRYAERVLVCVCEAELTEESWLLIVVLNDSSSAKSNFRSIRHCLSCTTQLFIRHNRSFVYYGTRSGQRPDGHHEWLITGLNLETGKRITEHPFRLANFVGSDIGSTACFEIHADCLFAVSNQTSFEVEEVDWTSYYNCIKIPLGETKPHLEARRKWQRQHLEGPINDSWTELSLQKDEQTEELLIVECRKEWLGGGSANVRTYYTKPLRFDEGDEATPNCNFPANDPLARTLDDNSKPNFTEPQKRIRKHYHREYEQSRLDPRNSPSRDFIFAKTRFRGYNVSAMSFVDLVSDPAPIPGSVRTRDRLRLRIASRKQKSPLVDDPDNPGHSLLRERELDEKGEYMEDSDMDFQPTEVHLWPQDDAPPELYDLLCPTGRAGNIEAVADERSIVYMTDPPGDAPRRGRAIVMISFDPAWGHSGLKKLAVPTARSPAAPPKELKLQLPNSFSPRPASKRGLPASERLGASTVSEGAPGPSEAKRLKFEPPPEAGQMGGEGWLIRCEKARYCAINRGYWLR